MTRPSKRVRRACPAPADSSDSSKTPSPNRISKNLKAMPVRPPSPTSAQKTIAHLREAGWRDFHAGQSVEGETFCVCAAPENEFNIEEAILCCNRNCEVSYFHLICMQIPEHLPRSIGWMCPVCRIKHKSKELGLYDSRGNGEKELWKEWLEKERRKKKILKPGGEISRLFGEDSVDEVEERSGTPVGASKRKREDEKEASKSALTAEENTPGSLAVEGESSSTLAADEVSSSTLVAEDSPAALAKAKPTVEDSDSSDTSELTELVSEEE